MLFCVRVDMRGGNVVLSHDLSTHMEKIRFNQ